MAEINYKLDVFEGPMDLLLYLITKRSNGLSLEEIVFAPFGIVESVAVQQHDEPFHLHAPNLFGQNAETLAFKFAICHCHVNHL